MSHLLYLYKQSKNGIELYVHGISIVDGLKALDRSYKIKLISFGATLYENYGFATEKDIPEFREPEELIRFLNQAGEIGLVDFEIEIRGKGKMFSQRDKECHFILDSKKLGIEILRKIAPESQYDSIVANLLKNKGVYITIDTENTIAKFATLDEFVAAKRNKA